ncbi:MAG: MmcQ/YjbR family DNA-binding protein [Kordiimonadaceae bacterium]|nr:MmcQ/YjbR family DNA-binding protein [Kordiimonadaceae bacterium]MBT6031221.1 MmcQ/YjbR family DNA-binding protein [Kordiimonadaceae bacterium]
MTRDEFDNYCGSLKSTTHVVQWGDASVWKIGGKVFAIHSGLGNKNAHSLSFKCSDLNFQILCELDGIIPAPYLARGKWVQLTTKEAMNNQDAKDYISASYGIISKKLTKKLQAELGL